MHEMFKQTESFTGEGLGAWVVSNVIYMYSMVRTLALKTCQPMFSVCQIVPELTRRTLCLQFDSALAFSADITAWDVSKCVDFDSMFSSISTFNQDLSDWNVSSALYMGHMFNATALNQDFCSWGQLVPPDAVVSFMFADTKCPDAVDPSSANFAEGPWCSTC